jgi:AP-4 complex subunit mu-1
VSMTFEIPMYNVSNLQVKYLRIAEASQNYNPYRWVRYVTRSSSYVCRCR